MSTTKPIETLSPIRSHELTSDRRQFNLIFVLAYALLIVGFAIARLLPGSQGVWNRERSPRRSVFEKARAEANILASFALTR